MKLVSFYENASANGLTDILCGVLDDAGTAVLNLDQAAKSQGAEPSVSLSSMPSFLASWPASLELTRQLIQQEVRLPADSAWQPLDQVRLAAPLPVPTSIRDCMTFEEHVVNCLRAFVRQRFPPLLWLDRLVHATVGQRLLRPPRSWYERPLYYKGNCRSVVGPEAEHCLAKLRPHAGFRAGIRRGHR